MASVAVLERHLLVRRDPPVWPFVWRGLLPLLALAAIVLLALGPFARLAIEASVAHEMRAGLDAAGFTWVGLDVSGQKVFLSGAEPAAGAGASALALARSATCGTWIGRHTCAVSVTGRFSAPAPLAAAPAFSGSDSAAAASSMRSLGSAGPDGAAGSASSHGAANSAASAGSAGSAGTATQACDRSLAAVLAGEQVAFASGSATIDASSGPLLDRLASEVKACPGMIRVEGHTDTIGRGAFNRALSQARAAAVRQALIARGVPAGRLRAKGFGARRPIGDNTTEEGRARNRRIEFHTVSAS